MTRKKGRSKTSIESIDIPKLINDSAFKRRSNLNIESPTSYPNKRKTSFSDKDEIKRDIELLADDDLINTSDEDGDEINDNENDLINASDEYIMDKDYVSDLDPDYNSYSDVDSYDNIDDIGSINSEKSYESNDIPKSISSSSYNSNSDSSSDCDASSDTDSSTSVSSSSSNMRNNDKNESPNVRKRNRNEYEDEDEDENQNQNENEDKDEYYEDERSEEIFDKELIDYPDFREELSVFQSSTKKLLLRRFALEILLSNEGNAFHSLMSLLSSKDDCKFIESAWSNSIRSIINAKNQNSIVRIDENNDKRRKKNTNSIKLDIYDTEIDIVDDSMDILKSQNEDLLICGGIDPINLDDIIDKYNNDNIDNIEDDIIETNVKNIPFGNYASKIGANMSSIESMSFELQKMNSGIYNELLEKNDQFIKSNFKNTNNYGETKSSIIDDVFKYTNFRNIVLMGDDDFINNSDRSVFPESTAFVDGHRVSWKGLTMNNFPDPIKKYHFMKYMLNHKMDNLYTDFEGWYSITPEATATALADLYGKLIPGESFENAGVIVDGFAGVGGNTMTFAKRCERHVVGIEWDSIRIACAKANAVVYGVNEGDISWIQDDIISGITKVKKLYEKDSDIGVHLWHFSPPWGGPQYLSSKVFNLEFMDINMGLIIKEVTKGGHNKANMMFFLPRNTNRNQLIELTPEGSKCEIMNLSINGKVRALMAIYGDIARDVE